jgi:saccharopine dehydrogenase (NAD+, L-lysine-forming)
MPKVIVLGGVGAVGRVAARTLAAHPAFDHVTIADIREDEAKAIAGGLGPKASAVHVDAGDAKSVHRAVLGHDVVLNCTGPFYAYARTVLQAVIDARIAYVDVCDDVDATIQLLDMDAAARAAGVTALIGMGNSPGVTNLLGRFAADNLLDETHAIDIYHCHGGEAFEGEGVIAHRFRGMSTEIPMFLDGELRHVRFFEPDGLALRERVDFHNIGTGVPVYPYPHPEQITMPRSMKVRRVTNKGTVLPDEYFRLTTELARLGLTSDAPIEVRGQRVVPRDFAIAWLKGQRDVILERTKFGTQRGCTMVVTSGLRHGKPRAYRFSMSSGDMALGEGTGIPAAMGAILLQQGKIKGPGSVPPEAGVNPIDFLMLVKPVLAAMPGTGTFEGVVLEKVDENGQLERVPLPL